MSPAAQIRPMRSADVAVVAALEAVLFGDDAWSAEQVRAELAAAGRHYLVAAAPEGPLVAYAGLLVGLDTAEVLRLGVAPTAQRTGLGRRLLRALLAEAARRSVPAVLLEVRADAAGAIALYESEGFTTIGVRRGYYARGAVDALVLRRLGAPSPLRSN